MEADVVEFLRSNRFEVCPFGSYGLYGLRLLGCNSIIMVFDAERAKNDLQQHVWKFLYFPDKSDYHATYMNEEGSICTFDFTSDDFCKRVTRLQKVESEEEETGEKAKKCQHGLPLPTYEPIVHPLKLDSQ